MRGIVFVLIASSVYGAESKVSDKFLNGLRQYESKGGKVLKGDNGASTGPYHIQKIYVREANRIAKIRRLPVRYDYSMRKCEKRSREMVRIVLMFWERHWTKKGFKITEPDLMAFHRGYFGNWKPSTKTATRIERNRTRFITAYMKGKQDG